MRGDPWPQEPVRGDPSSKNRCVEIRRPKNRCVEIRGPKNRCVEIRLPQNQCLRIRAAAAGSARSVLPNSSVFRPCEPSPPDRRASDQCPRIRAPGNPWLARVWRWHARRSASAAGRCPSVMHTPRRAYTRARADRAIASIDARSHRDRSRFFALRFFCVARDGRYVADDAAAVHLRNARCAPAAKFSRAPAPSESAAPSAGRSDRRCCCSRLPLSHLPLP